MKKTSHPRIINAIICDEVRQENNGKYIIIGAYTGSVIFPSFPARTMLSVYLEAMPTKAGPVALNVRFCGPDGAISGIEGEVEVLDGGKPVAFPTPRLPIALEKQGNLVVEVSFDKGKSWIEATRRLAEAEEMDIDHLGD